jgi:hypothetical protein
MNMKISSIRMKQLASIPSDDCSVVYHSPRFIARDQHTLLPSAADSEVWFLGTIFAQTFSIPRFSVKISYVVY